MRFLLPLLCLGAALTAHALDPKDVAGFSRYEADNARLKAEAPSPTRVVLIGNSITDEWIKIHPDFFAPNNFVCRGIGGQTSHQILLRFREDVVELKPAVVVISGGTNDVAQNLYDHFNLNRTMGNIASMAEIARANGIKVILTSVHPATAFWWNKSITDIDAKISALNARIADYARANGIPYVDYYTPMATFDTEKGTNIMNPAYANDGVHPNSDGYTVMEARLLPVVKALLGR